MTEKFFSDVTSIIVRFTTCYHREVISQIVHTRDYIAEPKRFFYTVILKTNNTLNALNIYLRDFDKKPEYHISLFILLRAILSDVIVSEYIIVSGANDAQRSEIIERIYMDHVDKTNQSIDRIYALINRWDLTRVATEKSEFLKSASQYFDSNGELLVKPLRTSPETLLKLLLTQKPNSANFDLLRKAFECYDRFSKYEHLGLFSFLLVHRGYDDRNIIKCLIEIFDAINIIFAAQLNYCNAWNFESQITELSNIYSEFQQIINQGWVNSD